MLGLSSWCLGQVQLAEKMAPKREPPGKVLCRRGDAALRLWILTEGSVCTCPSAAQSHPHDVVCCLHAPVMAQAVLGQLCTAGVHCVGPSMTPAVAVCTLAEP